MQEYEKRKYLRNRYSFTWTFRLQRRQYEFSSRTPNGNYLQLGTRKSIIQRNHKFQFNDQYSQLLQRSLQFFIIRITGMQDRNRRQLRIWNINRFPYESNLQNSQNRHTGMDDRRPYIQRSYLHLGRSRWNR